MIDNGTNDGENMHDVILFSNNMESFPSVTECVGLTENEQFTGVTDSNPQDEVAISPTD